MKGGPVDRQSVAINFDQWPYRPYAARSEHLSVVGDPTPKLPVETSRKTPSKERLECWTRRQERDAKPLGLPAVIRQAFSEGLEGLKQEAVDRQDNEPESAVSWRPSLVLGDEAVDDIREAPSQA